MSATLTQVWTDPTEDVSFGVYLYVRIATLLLRMDVALTIKTIASQRARYRVRLVPAHTRISKTKEKASARRAAGPTGAE